MEIFNSRYELYEYSYNYLGEFNTNAILKIREHFHIAMVLLYELEPLQKEINNNDSDFLTQFRLNAERASSSVYFYLYETELNSLFINSDLNEKSKDYLLFRLIKIISKIHNTVIKIAEIKEIKAITVANDYMNQVFLSYAYDDKGLTYALFLYFLSHNVFLYIDWMWNDANEDCYVLKQNLSGAISKSNQFLLLRSPNLEYKIKGSRQIRQWCSWECGVAFDVMPDEKYIINFASVRNDNMFTKDLKVMSGIDEKSYRIK